MAVALTNPVGRAPTRPYVHGVNLLLLLSALLSALSGLGASVRAPQTPVIAALVADTTASEPARARPVVRRGVTLPAPRAIGPMVRPMWMLAPLVPLFLSRRRE